MNDTIEEETADNEQNNEESTSGWFWRNFSLLELSGSCGDFGTLIPLLVALGRQRAIFMTPTLLGTGVLHIINGFVFDIPMPLQPMKAIASLAIASELNRREVTIAGVGMGVCFVVFGVFKGAIELLHRWIPQSVIGGLQLGVGWKLAIRGIHMIQELPWLVEDPLDNKFWSIVCGLFCLYSLRRPLPGEDQSTSTKFPVGMLLFGLGVVLAFIRLATQKDDVVSYQKEPFVLNALKGATLDEWKTGLLEGMIPQLPLTTLNSCLSVCLLAGTLFPSRPHAVKRRTVCWSIGLMNLCLCPLGMMPNCHGAGGLAGQHRLGAKSGVSMVALGIFKIALSVLAHHGWLLHLLDALPVSILGFLLVLAGHELALTGVVSVFEKSQSAATTCLLTGLVIVGTQKTHVGALCGWITYLIHDGGYQDLCCSRRSLADEHTIGDVEQYSQLRPNSSGDD